MSGGLPVASTSTTAADVWQAPSVMPPRIPLVRRAASELVGTAALVAVVVGSGIQAGELSGDGGVQLLANSLATVFGLGVLILLFGPVSGAHFNPVVTLAEWWTARRGGPGVTGREVAAYVPAQVAGAIGGAVLADAMFDRALVEWSGRDRSGGNLLLGEVVATAGLVLLVFGLARTDRLRFAPIAVASYIGAAYWFTSSTSFANPAVTVGRAFSDTFAGIEPASVPGFVAAQLVGGVVGLALVAVVFGRPGTVRADTRPPAEPAPPVAAVRTAPPAVAVHPPSSLEGNPIAMPDKPSVLFVCVHNAGRSQMAAGFLRHLAGDRVEVRSAGSVPGDRVNPVAVEAMKEVGIDIADRNPQVLTPEAVQASDVVITMGCGDACPIFPGKRYLDWRLPDPAGRGIDAVRPIRDEIEQYIRTLIGELLPGDTAIGATPTQGAGPDLPAAVVRAARP